MSGSPLIVALDTADLSVAEHWATTIAPHCGLLKLGLQFFCAHGPAGVALIRHPIFLDLKLHDIPATVAGAVRSLAPLAPALLSLHAAGGVGMIEAARSAAEQTAGRRTALLAVTVLTSLDQAALARTGVPDDMRAQVLRLARLALAAGADGLVCSGHEVALLRDALGPEPILVVPGIRPVGDPGADQARITPPHAAMAAGATYIVVGRPVTDAPDPAAAAAAILASL